MGWRESSNSYRKCKISESENRRRLERTRIVESIPLEEQETGRKLIHPENAFDLSGSVQSVYVENHTQECVEVCAGQRLGTIHSMCIDEAAWLKAELRGGSKQEVSDDEEEVTSETINTLQESDYPTEESKREFIRESFKIDEN